MKTITIIIFATIGMLVQASDKLFDENLATNAVAVLRVHKIQTWQLPLQDKYPYTRYIVNGYEVFKNESNENLHKSISVHGFTGQDGVPSGECTIYIARYDVTNRRFDKTNGTIWMLVGGNATNGVSHVDEKAALR
jgi:hypothetical protein